MARPRPQISQSELLVLKSLWQKGPATVRQLAERLPKSGKRWAYTTVQTLLARMEQKGYVTCDRGGFAHVFAAALSRDELLAGRVAELAEELGGDVPAPLVLALVERTRFTSEEIKQFRALLQRLSKEADKR